jgi:hypothetical protein
MKKIIVLLSLTLLLTSTLIYRSEVCCMFSGARYYGWPSAFVTVSKTTDNLDEAKKIETNNLPYLLRNGWKMYFGAGMGQYGVSSSAIFNLITNYLLYLIIASLLVKNLKKKKI